MGLLYPTSFQPKSATVIKMICGRGGCGLSRNFRRFDESKLNGLSVILVYENDIYVIG